MAAVCCVPALYRVLFRVDREWRRVCCVIQDTGPVPGTRTVRYATPDTGSVPDTRTVLCVIPDTGSVPGNAGPVTPYLRLNLFIINVFIKRVIKGR